MLLSKLFQRGGVVASSLFLLLANGYAVQAQPVNETEFQLYPADQKLIPCMAAPGQTPTVRVKVKRGERNDQMTVVMNGFKPGLQFDLFTLEKTLLKSDATRDPNFNGFGFAWYQTDLEPGATTIRTILLDQIFGLVLNFPPQASVPPTKTFHVGFWFNNPQDAKACGFDVTKPTPFNGEQKAGPLAFISVPNKQTNLGPLCTKPNTSTSPVTCDP